MTNNEIRISSYIDDLNNEKIPKEHMTSYENKDSEQEEEMEALMSAVRMIRTLKEPAKPVRNFEEKLVKSLRQRNNRKHSKKIWIPGLVSAAAILIFILFFFNLIPIFQNNTNIVYAIEKAYEKVEAYYGNLEILSINEEGEKALQSELEIWSDKEGNYYTKVLSGQNSGLITVNNGEQKWQIKTDESKVFLYSSFPDLYRFAFDLGKEVKEIKNAIEVKEAGVETIGGIETKKLEIIPKGGLPYYLWIDIKTKLPIQRETAMTNGLQYRVTYSSIKYADRIPENLLILQVPQGYVVDDTNSWQIVNSQEEVGEALSFVPQILKEIPEGFLLNEISINENAKASRIYYTSKESQEILLLQENKNINEWKIDPVAVIGEVNGSPAEILTLSEESGEALLGSGVYAGESDIISVRWREGDSELRIISNLSLGRIEELIVTYFGKTAEFPLIGEGGKGDTSGKGATVNESQTPQIEVPVDLEVEKNDQQSVDAGHSPWRLDPAFVAQVFASLKLYPEGITGDYPIAYEDIQIIQNDGVRAVAKISGEATIIDKVYLERLVRQDETGIWTVVAYDPKQE